MKPRQGHLGRVWWGWGVTVAGHRWVRVEWRRTRKPGAVFPYPEVRFWEVQWR